MEDRERQRMKLLIKLGTVIGAIGFFGMTGFASVLSVFVNGMEKNWGFLVLSIICFSISVGAVYILVNYHDMLIERKEMEDKGYKNALEEEIEKRYNSKLDDLTAAVTIESARIRNSIEDMRYYGGCR